MDASASAGSPSPSAPTSNASQGGAAATSAGESSHASQASGTNNQVADVDEADFLKNDGKYIYVVNESGLHIFDAWPATQIHEVSRTALPGTPKKLFVEGDRAVVYVSVPREVTVSSSGESGARATAYMPSGSSECTYGYGCDFTGDGTSTKILVFDLQNRASPAPVRELSLSGALLGGAAGRQRRPHRGRDPGHRVQLRQLRVPRLDRLHRRDHAEPVLREAPRQDRRPPAEERARDREHPDHRAPPDGQRGRDGSRAFLRRLLPLRLLRRRVVHLGALARHAERRADGIGDDRQQAGRGLRVGERPLHRRAAPKRGQRLRLVRGQPRRRAGGKHRPPVPHRHRPDGHRLRGERRRQRSRPQPIRDGREGRPPPHRDEQRASARPQRPQHRRRPREDRRVPSPGRRRGSHRPARGHSRGALRRGPRVRRHLQEDRPALRDRPRDADRAGDPRRAQDPGLLDLHAHDGREPSSHHRLRRRRPRLVRLLQRHPSFRSST